VIIDALRSALPFILAFADVRLDDVAGELAIIDELVGGFFAFVCWTAAHAREHYSQQSGQ